MNYYVFNSPTCYLWNEQTALDKRQGHAFRRATSPKRCNLFHHTLCLDKVVLAHLTTLRRS